MGRKKGSKNKVKIQEPIVDTIEPIKRGRGRPRKIKLNDDELEIKKDNTLLVNLFGDTKDIKKEIRRLRKIKLQCRPRTAERLDLEHKIKDLKKQLNNLTIPDLDKDPIIAEILKIEADQKLTPRFENLGIDLHKYTKEQLQFHLKRIKNV